MSDKKYTVIELKKMCKDKGIKGYSKLRKKELMKKCLDGLPQKKQLTNIELKKMCKDKGIKGYSKLRKKELIKKCLGLPPKKKKKKRGNKGYKKIQKELKNEEYEQIVDIFELYEDVLKKYSYEKLKKLQLDLNSMYERNGDIQQYGFKTEEAYLDQDIDELDIEILLK